MKYLNNILAFIIILFASCERHFDDLICDDGEIVERIISLDNDTFDQIIIYDNVQLNIIQDNSFEVKIIWGSKKIDNIELTVKDSVLEIKNNSDCWLIDNYSAAEVYLKVPNLRSIRNSSISAITSTDTLKFDNLIIYVEDWLSDYNNMGDVKLTVQSSQLRIVANGFSKFEIDGKVSYFNCNFASNAPYLDARMLQLETFEFLNRSANTMKVAPIDKIKGIISGVGNVEVYSRPPIVEVEEKYKGKLVFK